MKHGDWGDNRSAVGDDSNPVTRLPAFQKRFASVRRLNLFLRYCEFFRYILPDYLNNQLVITLSPLANQRSNGAIRNVMHPVHLSQTRYSATALILRFKIAAIGLCRVRSSEFTIEFKSIYFRIETAYFSA
jgi:hypothetical protein